MQCFLCSILFSIMMLQNSMTVQEPHTAKSFLSFTFAIRTSMERLQKHVEMVQNNAKTIRIEKTKFALCRVIEQFYLKATSHICLLGKLD